MKIRTLLFVGLLAMSGISPAAKDGNFYIAGRILSFCESKSDTEVSFCMLYLTGIADASDTLNAWGRLPLKQFCTPRDVTVGQLRKIFIKYANERPQELHVGAGSLALNAFGIAFPCE